MILDKNGKPMVFHSKKPTFDEVAVIKNGRDVTRGYVFPDFPLAVQDTVLQLAGGGNYDIYKDILRDPYIASCLQQRFTAVTSKEYIVEPASNKKQDKMAADFIREWLQQIRFDDITYKMLYGIFYGYAIGEVMYARDGGNITITDIKVRDRRRFLFDGEQRLRLRTPTSNIGELLPPKKFWSFNYGADHDDEPYGLGLAYRLYWPAQFRKFGEEFWANYLERYVNPPVVGEYPAGAIDEQKQTLEDAALSLQSDAVAIYPTGMILKYLESTRNSSADYKEFLAEMNNLITLVILSQSATTTGSAGALGNEESRVSVKEELVEADADLFSQSFNKGPVGWLTEYNYPNARPPLVWREMAKQEDLNSRAERDTKIYGLGYKLTDEAVKEIYGEDYEPIQVEKTEKPILLDTQDENALLEEEDEQVNADFAEAEFKDSLNPILTQLKTTLARQFESASKPLDEFAQRVNSLEEFRDGIYELYQLINTEDVVNSMSEAAMLAWMVGQTEVEDGN